MRIRRLPWARLILLTIAALSLALGASFAAAPAASAEVAAGGVACPAIYPRPAYCDPGASTAKVAPLSFEGWAYLNLNYCQPGYACAAVHRISARAWFWTGRMWVQTQITGGQSYYLHPFSGSWRWACDYTRCVAVEGLRFELKNPTTVQPL